MKARIFSVLFFLLGVSSCQLEDPGPRQEANISYSLVDFDRIEVSDAMDVTVIKGSVFSITASGDRRDMDDLSISRLGTTLTVHYSSRQKRQYTTFIVIMMPVLNGVDFSNAVNGRVLGFTDTTPRFDASLSGAAVGQFEMDAQEIHLVISGASEGIFSGAGQKLEASISGASNLFAFQYPVGQAEVVVSGASQVKLSVTNSLTAIVSGASQVTYKGDPQLESDVSSESSIIRF